MGDIGVPLIAGPAVITTLLTLPRTHGPLATVIAFGLNLVIVRGVLGRATVIGRVLGVAGSQAFATAVSVLLAAIGVPLVREGLMAALSRV
jgi:multiple antibiotic resistance protein